MSNLRPDLRDISMSYRFLDDIRSEPAPVVAAVVCLVAFSVSSMVWTMKEPRDGGIDPDEPRLARVCGLKPKQWAKVKDQAFRHFDLRDGKFYPKAGWYSIGFGTRRPSVPPALRQIVGERDNWTCGYCGSRSGPFDIDHVVPVTRGGSLADIENLLCACAACNRSKGARYVAEWIS